MSSNLAEIRQQLVAMVRDRTGDRDALVSEPVALPGHAGLSYSFELDWRSSAGPAREKLVIRLAPAGVRAAGPADVARQGRIMASLADTAVPVPPIRWIDEDPRWFGRPFFVGGFVAGEKLGELNVTAEQARPMVQSTVETLAALHAVDWQSRRDAWGEPAALAGEMQRLDHLLDRDTLDPAAVARAPLAREALRSSLPAAPRIGCVHGDFQWSNLLMRDGGVAAVIDWELAQVGATLLDLGWLCLFSDPDSWHSPMLIPARLPSLDEIVAIYTQSARFPVSIGEVRWFQAFSAYRFGVITAFNLMLHRRGKRHDPMWEEIGKSAPRLFERALELLS
ncbi:MAG: phosphotransferase family protein [Candidatus Binatales bacterium]